MTMTTNISVLLLQAAPQAGGNPLVTVGIMSLMFVVMYFFMIRPQAQKAKEQKKFSDNIDSGNYVVTTAGIHGTITRVNEDGTLQLEISRGTFIKIERSAVSQELTEAHAKKAGGATVSNATSAKN